MYIYDLVVLKISETVFVVVLYIYKYVFPKNIYTFHSMSLDLIYETVALYVHCNPRNLIFSQFSSVGFQAS